MAASSSSNGIPSEAEVKPHPHQIPTEKGPKGAYEAQQVNGGLYVRVDMPGVPPCGVKLMKYGETRKVTFTGKAPKLWPECDKSDRVYGGYVVLNCDPTEIDVEMHVKNGVMRLFFPNADGTLHSLKLKKKADDPMSKIHGDAEGCSYAIGMKKEPRRMCPCCRKPQDVNCPLSSSITDSHINPYLLQGVEGVYEGRLVIDEATKKESLYLRVDFPGLGEKDLYINRLDDKCLHYGGEGEKEFRLDEAGREYFGKLSLNCPCCRIKNVDHEMKDGVMRMLISKTAVFESIGFIFLGKFIFPPTSYGKHTIEVDESMDSQSYGSNRV